MLSFQRGDTINCIKIIAKDPQLINAVESRAGYTPFLVDTLYKVAYKV